MANKLKIINIPHMLKMWDYEKNNESPESVSVYCTDKKHWKCPDCGYSWSVPPKTRYKGSGKCPCHESNKVICRGVNDVLTIVKGLDTLISENNDYEAIYKEGVDSNLSVNFKCDECGRKWTAPLKSQIKKEENGSYVAKGCPHYNTSKRKIEEVPFCSEVESLSRFWDPNNLIDPFTTKSNVNDSAHFICTNCGYEWTTSIRAQTRGTGKCKCCELQRVVRKGFTDVFTLVPESKRFFNFNKNKDIDIYSIPLKNNEIDIDWQCPNCGREWSSTLRDRIKGKKDDYSFIGCRDCILHQTITPVASIPKLIKQWNFKKNKIRGLDPNLTSAYLDEPADWRCKACGYEWESNIRSRTNSNGRCPFCEGKHKPVLTGTNDVLSLCPELASIYDFEYNNKNGIDIYKEGVNSKTEAHFKCQKCGNEWNSPIYKRIRKNEDGTYRLVDCSACSHALYRKIPYSVEFPLLAKMYKEDLNHISLDSIRGKKAVIETFYFWDCPDCGETFDSTLNAMITSYNTTTHGCPYCSHTRLRKGESFAELHPDLMHEYCPENLIDPYQTFPNCKEDVEWICRVCGHYWRASFALRHKGMGKCPVCNEYILEPNINSLKARYPEIANRWSPRNRIGPDMILSNSYDWFRWICPVCSGDYGAYVNEVVKGNDECPYCNNTKILPNFNSFAHNHPELIKELDEIANYLLPVSPNEVGDDSGYKFWWKCENDSSHKYLMSPRTRLMFDKRGREPCLYCRGYRRKLNHFIFYNEKRKGLLRNEIIS